MNIITVKTQAEWDALPAKFDTLTTIHIKSRAETWLVISKCPESSHVEAWESSHVEAWGNSHVEAWGNSHVVARGSSHVVAWGSSHVEAWGSVSVQVQSDDSTIILFALAVAITRWLNKVEKKTATATIILKPEPTWTVEGYLDREGVTADAGRAILFKRVSSAFKTQEKTGNETDWSPGKEVELANYTPTNQECGVGKFHAVSRPYFADEFRSKSGDRYVAIEIATADMHAWKEPQFMHKIAFRKGKVLYECNRFGEKL